MKNYTINVEGKSIQVDFNSSTQVALRDMELTPYIIYGTILSLGKELCDLKDNEQVVILDELMRKGIIFVYDESTEAIVVLAVVDMDRVYVKTGTRVIKYK